MITGDTETVEVVALPALALQVYVEAPVAVRVDDSPVQIVAGLAKAVMVKEGITFTVTVCVPKQVPFAPVTV